MTNAGDRARTSQPRSFLNHRPNEATLVVAAVDNSSHGGLGDLKELLLVRNSST